MKQEATIKQICYCGSLWFVILNFGTKNILYKCLSCGYNNRKKQGGQMAGNQAGGQKAAETNKKRYGKKFYSTIGRKGGQISRGGGFASSHELAVEAGRKGGKASRRGPAKYFSDEDYPEGIVF